MPLLVWLANGEPRTDTQSSKLKLANHQTRCMKAETMDRSTSSPYASHTEQQQISDDGNSPEPATGQKRKRIRASRACETCRARKVKCNEQNPCSNCIRKYDL